MKLTAIVARVNHPDLLAALDVYQRDGWKIQGGLAYGDGRWAVLLVKEKAAELQHPYETERKLAYQEVAVR